MKELVSDFVLFCSGVNVKFLRANCPNDRHKFYPIGLGVIVTALLAFISMMFATHSIFGAQDWKQELVLILFSIFWAFAIFTIDWGLVKTMKKSANTNPSIGERFRFVIPVIFRLFVAVILSYSISRPMEVKIYEKRLKGQIETDRLAFVERQRKADNVKIIILQRKQDSLGKILLGIKNTIAKGSINPVDKQQIKQSEDCQNALVSLRAEISKKIDDDKKSKKRITNDSSSYRKNTLGKRFLTSYAVKSIAKINKDISNLNRAVENKETECSMAFQQVKENDTRFQERYSSPTGNTQAQYETITAEISRLKTNDTKSLASVDSLSKQSFDSVNPGLITQLESMSNFEKTPEGKSAGMVRLILLLVIICIDTAPVVIKLLTKRGAYEQMMDEEEGRLMYLTRHESYSNKRLIYELSLAQKVVLTKAIEQWKIKELGKDNLPDGYINSNPDE